MPLSWLHKKNATADYLKIVRNYKAKIQETTMTNALFDHLWKFYQKKIAKYFILYFFYIVLTFIYYIEFLAPPNIEFEKRIQGFIIDKNTDESQWEERLRYGLILGTLFLLYVEIRKFYNSFSKD